MGKDKIGFGIALGVALASLPVWRSGEKKGLNLFEFIGEHTVFCHQRQWVQLRDKSTDDDIWVELVEKEPKNRLLYIDDSGRHRGELIAYV